MVASQNGWRANDRSVIASISIPGGSLAVRVGDIGTIFQHLATRFNNEVEALVWPGNWGYAERPIRGGTQLSNHASGTAIDLNAPKHPLGTNPAANYTAAQIAKIHEIVEYYEGIIRWGGDYVGRKDGMHFEINDGITEAQVARIAAKIRGGVAPAPAPAPAKVIPAWTLPAGHYYGLITGPAKSHGGINAAERAAVKLIQQKLQALGFAPNYAGWADGKFEQATANAVAAFQRKHMPGTTFYGQVWSDDWRKLFSL